MPLIYILRDNSEIIFQNKHATTQTLAVIKDDYPMTLSKYYKNAVLYPSIVTIILTFIFSIIDNYDYKSEWMTADYVIFLSVVTSIIYCSIISLLSTTIFLNRFDKIKNNSILNFLTWFLLPFVLIIVVFFHEVSFKIKYNETFGNDFIYIFILNFPFIVGLIWTYYKYKKINYRKHLIYPSSP